MTTHATPSTGSDLPDLAVLARLFPEYEVRDLLGRGGMGAVYRAHHTRLDRPVAIKVLLPGLAADAEFAARFTREARAMARLSHPHVVSIHDFGAREGHFFLIMELVDGPNLRQLIEGGDLAPEDALRIVPQVCEALQFAHDRGIVHRDIKPENILIDEDLWVRITDFGLAKVLDSEERSMLTRSEQVFGTPHYMAPEQLRGTGNVDRRADIYSLGVVLYEMLTGELPIGRFDLPSARRGVAADMDRVVMKSLANEPAQRYQTARELRDDLTGAPDAAPQPRSPASARRTVFSRFDLLLAPGQRLAKSDVAWLALGTALLNTFLLFFPWYEGQTEWSRIYSLGYSGATSTLVSGWQLLVYDLPMFLVFVYSLAFLALATSIASGSRVPRRALLVPSLLCVLQIGSYLGIITVQEHGTQIAPMAALLNGLAMVYLAVAKVER